MIDQMFKKLRGIVIAGVVAIAWPAQADELLPEIRVRNSSGSVQSRVPIIFGQVFALGALKAGESVAGRLPDASQVRFQLDVKATHADGSVRHAVLSTTLPTLPAKRTEAIQLVKAKGLVPAATAPTRAQVLASGFTSEAVIVVDGKTYRASTEQGLKAPQQVAWLAGPVVNEWLITAPFKTAEGAEHPHLHARFALRAVGDPIRVRVDVSVENDWAFEPAPKNFIYDVDLQINKKSVYAKTALTHYHHARWRKTFWSGAVSEVELMHDTAYLIATRAVPNYDQRITVPEATLARWKADWTEARAAPMSSGMATPYMPTTGGRPDIGLMPGWTSAYLLSMDPRAKEVMLGTANLSGSWSSHYRDRATGRPVSIVNFPYMTRLGRSSDTFNPVTKKSEAFPDCAGDCKNPQEADTAHLPAFSYVPYLVTGDFYHLEELQFWVMYSLFQSNPGYRDNVKGLLKWDQTRGQAWSMRNLGEVAYITPDNDPLKSQLRQFLKNNLDWYNETYTDNPKANKLGIITNGFAIEYDGNTGIAPWQDDFFTQAIGHVAELGFEQARALLAWKSKFSVGRMIDPQYCWIMGAAYSVKVRSKADAEFFTSLGDVYRASNSPELAALKCGSPEMVQALKLKPGEMTGYADGSAGYPSNMQPALAYGADVGGVAGKKAWAIFDARKIKPDYSSAPSFAIVPR